MVCLLLVAGCGDGGSARDAGAPDAGEAGLHGGDGGGGDGGPTDRDGAPDPDPVCGNGRIEEGEDCEGEDTGDGTCQGEGFAAGALHCEADRCRFDTTDCIPAICGDGVADGPEQCDGEDLADSGCSDLGYRKGRLRCDADCLFDASRCVVSECGDDYVDGEEECDGIALGGGSCADLGLPSQGVLGCRTDCRYAITNCLKCGDGTCHPGERASLCPADCAVTDVAAGSQHTCAVRADGSVWCWGARAGHRMGGTGDVNVPVRLVDGEGSGAWNATRVVVGSQHSCLLRADGSVRCWGANGFGEAGQPASNEVYPPAPVDGLPPAERLAAGLQHSCASTLDGPGEQGTYCWGRGDYGAVGGNDFALRNPAAVRAGPECDALHLGARHSCLLRGSGGDSPYCWGSDERGQQASASSRLWVRGPVQLANGTVDFSALGSGHDHVCATVVAAGDPLFCWGNNESGQVGVTASADNTGLNNISGRTAVTIDGGRDHTCIMKEVPGAVRCWGGNDVGQLGDGTTTSRHEEAAVPGLSNVQRITMGARHGCALLDDGTLRCWGDNAQGQLGDGSTLPHRTAPVAPYGMD